MAGRGKSKWMRRNEAQWRSVIIPRQSRGLCFVSRSKRLDGVANAAPNSRGHLSVAGSAPQSHLVQSHVFFLLVFDVVADHCLVPPHC
jgi:hypothetical protein